jgi:hypothetical protein
MHARWVTTTSSSSDHRTDSKFQLKLSRAALKEMEKSGQLLTRARWFLCPFFLAGSTAGYGNSAYDDDALIK